MVSADTGGRWGPKAPRKLTGEDEAARPMSDTRPACVQRGPEESDTEERPRSQQGPDLSAKLEARVTAGDKRALNRRAEVLGMKPSALLRAVLRDALDVRRVEEFDATIAAAMIDVQTKAQPTADARHLAAQIRPLALNINDLNRRARAGEAVTLGGDAAELVVLLREVRELLGDRVAQ